MSDIKSEVAKDLVEGVAAVGAGYATGGLVGAGAAFAPTAANIVSAAVKALVLRRQERFAQQLLRDDLTGDDYSTMIETKLAKDPKAGEYILRGARAASEAVDEAALAAIALLTRELVQDRIPSWFQRQALEVLSNVSAQELGDLKGLLNFLRACIRDQAVMVIVKAEPCHRAKVATVEGWWMAAEGPGGEQPATGQYPKAEKLSSAYHLFGLLQRSGLGTLPPAPYAGVLGRPEVGMLAFEVDVVQMFLRVIDPR